MRYDSILAGQWEPRVALRERTEEKACSRCHKVLPATKEFFGERKLDLAFGLDAACRKCKAAYTVRYNRRNRSRALNQYGGKCVCCGETRFEFLAFDHINGGGSEHMRGLGGPEAFIRWLRDNNYPDTIRVLCHNCNTSMGKYGYCPHGNLTN